MDTWNDVKDLETGTTDEHLFQPEPGKSVFGRIYEKKPDTHELVLVTASGRLQTVKFEEEVKEDAPEK